MEARCDVGTDDGRAGDAGGTVDVPSALVKQRDQMIELTGIIMGLLGFAPGSVG